MIKTTRQHGAGIHRSDRFLLAAITLLSGIHTGHGQWCVPTSAIPYNADMPGITRFTCNTIDRTSADIENYPNNNYVLTGLTTDLVKGDTYPVTIEFTIDGIICPDMNLRLWIDFNHDGQLDDVGETLIASNHVLPSTFNGSITIPNDAMTGPTRMRVAVKMSDLGGHTPPTPCDLPPDPFGFHGELEDYEVVINDAVGITEANGNEVPQISFDRTSMTLSVNTDLRTEIRIFDTQGRLVLSHVLGGGHSDRVPLGSLVPGAYLAQLSWSGRATASRFVVW